MQNDSLWSELINPLIVAIVGGVITSFLQHKTLQTSSHNKLFKPIPEYIINAGVNTFLYRLFGRKINIENAKIPSRKDYVLIFTLSLGVFLSIGCFSYFSLKIIVATPDGYTNLKYTKTDEFFLISENSAISYPNKKQWYLDQDICHSDIYQNIALKNNMSYELVYDICTSVGLKNEKEGIKKRVLRFQKDRKIITGLNFIFIAYCIVMITAICAPALISPKIVRYREKYFEDKFLNNH
ncbi:hypothetical protein HV183_02885 [Citrobacter freundii]|uniref:Uncharacterized protein n=1 Tax=Citrobacter freundii TaxID=546 RepID=A0AAE7KXE3_CITFR|nr:hypothetical protein [Citrobacter freundii]QLO12461.1 hypothetical protein HV183_02885 [Citrobacter freundii]